MSKKKKGKHGEESGVSGLFNKVKDFFMDYTPHCVFTTIILIISLSWWCCGRPDQAPVTVPDPNDDRIVPDEKSEEKARAGAPAGDEIKTGNEDQKLDETKAAEDKEEVADCGTPAKKESPAGSEGSVSKKTKDAKEERNIKKGLEYYKE